MKRAIFAYLKRRKLTEIQTINSLFLSAFMRYYKIEPHHNPLLVENYIKKCSYEETELLNLIAQLHKCECNYTLEELTQLFEFVISPSDRMITGAIYTPEHIRERIVQEVTTEYGKEDLATKRFADISCGCGGFFLTIGERLHQDCGKKFADIFRDNLFGIDIQDYAIERTKLLLSLQALLAGEDCEMEFNLFVANTLSFDFTRLSPIDIIVGNPPYVRARNISEESRSLLSTWSVCSSGNTDLYIPFFQIAIEHIKHGGKIGLITMNSFLLSLNGRSLRDYFSKKAYDIKIVDFRGYQVFSGKNTYTCLFFLTKIHSDGLRYCSEGSEKLPEKFHYRFFAYDSLIAKDGWKLNGFTNINCIENTGTPLGKYCQTRHGIATLSNKTYVFKPTHETKTTYFFIKNGHEYQVEKGICRKIVNPNKFNSGTSLAEITEHIIFPYFRNNMGRMEIIKEDVFHSNYPLAYRYLLSQREILEKRDKGATDKYPAWYAYGRTQSLMMPRYKLFFPKIANKRLHCVLNDEVSLLLYNGMAFVSDSKQKLSILKKILESQFFWNYVKLNSKPYASGYYALNGANIKKFGIPDFTEDMQKKILSTTNHEDINAFLQQLYDTPY